MSDIVEPQVQEVKSTQQAPAEPLKKSAQPGDPGFSFDDLIQSDNIIILASAQNLNTLPSSKVTAANSENHPDTNENPCIFVQDRINNVRYINKFLEAVNERLPMDGMFIGCVQTATLRKNGFRKKFGKFIAGPYYTLDYILHRVIPKIPYLKRIYFGITKGRNRAITEMEIFGRLYSCGFTLVHRLVLEESVYFVVRKVKQPEFNTNASYGPIISLKRYGENRKQIKVYKLRTMYPYSEYLQPFVYENRGLQEGGKIKNDPRINSVGKICRKYWLDELPMLYNLIKGDIKIVGVRPISAHYLSLYPKEFQEFRNRFKPGLIPPYYADLPRTFEEIMASEERYLKAYEQNKIKTDFIYLYKIFYNILIRGSRSH